MMTFILIIPQTNMTPFLPDNSITDFLKYSNGFTTRNNWQFCH